MNDEFYSLQMILEKYFSYIMRSYRQEEYMQQLLPLIANEENQ